MLDEIRSVIERWASKKKSKRRSEAIVKQSLIVPILRRLGWDDESDDEVVTEYNVGGGEVDYALSHDQTAKVFIEAKKEDEPLARHEEQLLNYAFRQGVVMAILTNGSAWWFYLSLREGSWENRKFAGVDIDEPELPQQLISLLSKENVISGTNIQSAETLLRSRRIWESLPRAWETVRPEIVNRLIDETEGLCDYRPVADDVEQFLSQLDNQAEPEAVIPAPQIDSLRAVPEADDVIGTRPRSFTFHAVLHTVNSWTSVLTTLCGVLHTMHGDRFEAEVLNLRSTRGNPYFSRNADDLRDPCRVNVSGIFVETNLSARYILKTAHMLISHFGYDPSELHVEYSPRG